MLGLLGGGGALRNRSNNNNIHTRLDRMREISNADGQLEKIDYFTPIRAPLIMIEAQYIARYSGKRHQSNRHSSRQQRAR